MLNKCKLSFGATWRYLFNLLLDNILIDSACIFSHVPLVLSLLLSLLNFLEKILIWLVKFVLIFLVKVFLFIIQSLINGIYELVLRSLETTFQTERIFIIVSIEGHLSLTGIISSLVSRFGELDLHRGTNLGGSIMLGVGVIEVRPVNDIFDV